ncbi:MAG: hypothetical protein CK532_03240 [Flavobacteriales bacterium]|nr:hypothetical protein [Flavobacteriaceae bacterium]PHX92467.1 MAG: hypothetical protein CK532_03240 [Flavobacteriales bacterium]
MFYLIFEKNNMKNKREVLNSLVGLNYIDLLDDDSYPGIRIDYPGITENTYGGIIEEVGEDIIRVKGCADGELRYVDISHIWSIVISDEE